ncbi:MAG: RluA family pseudouridine synthase [Marinilabiliaceae bacterium]
MDNNYRGSKKATSYSVKSDCTVQEFFERQMQGKSRTNQKQLLSKGAVRIGERVLKHLDDLILAGSTVTIVPKPDPQFIMPPGLNIVYEDDWLLVVYKESGLLTIATETEKDHTAFAYLSAYLKFYNRNDKVFIIHRIDRMTSGLLIFAKNETAQRILRSNWDKMVLSRQYVAVVEGRMEQTYGTVTTWLDEDQKSKRVYVCRPGTGKKATTHYELIDEAPGLSLLALELETGRKNQIRVHMNYIGHTLAGDKKYGSKIDPIGRLCLHARQIEFEHPMTGKILNFETKIPGEFLQLFRHKENDGERGQQAK